MLINKTVKYYRTIYDKSQESYIITKSIKKNKPCNTNYN